MTGKGDAPDANSACPRCGTRFRCGMVGGDAQCWCAMLPAVNPLPVPASAGTASCFCPDCLATIKGQNTDRAAGS